jgi:EamA domain-containing membrane protein RarD
VITYVNPAVAVVLGALVLNERITPIMLGAFALILGGSVLATRAGRPAPSQTAVETATALTASGDTHAGQQVPSACN